MGVKHGLSNLRKNIGYGYSKIWCCGTLFESKREEITGDWRKLHGEEFQGLYRMFRVCLEAL
jgi:hypothetical protein